MLLLFVMPVPVPVCVLSKRDDGERLCVVVVDFARG